MSQIIVNRIYCFVNQVNSMGFLVTAYAEDGQYLASHCSSNENWAKHDIGINSTWHHEKYKAKYPEGYELVWLDQKDDRLQGIIDMINKANKPTLVNLND